MKKPKWNKEFEGLPDIPEPKLWLPEEIGQLQTHEQRITFKLINGETINGKEINQLVDCINFYKDLKIGLQKLNFEGLGIGRNLEEFKAYIDYAYNYQLLHSNEVEIYRAFRIVRNFDGKTKETASQLSFPNLQIVKDLGLFNRASTHNATMFYCAESVDSAFKELKPRKGEVITLGIWEPKENPKFNCYPISSNSKAQSVNDNARSAFLALNHVKAKMPKILANFFDGYFDLLNYEYSKPINHHLEYTVSALFSEKIIEDREDEWTYDALIYPSVGNDFTHCNFAIKPTSANSKLKLVKAYEFEIIDADYSRPSNLQDPLRLTVANATILNESTSIQNDGTIKWK